MQLDMTIKFTPWVTMNKDGYSPSESSEKGSWYRNLIHWVSVNDYYFENIEECGDDGWEFKFYVDSNLLEGISYVCYVDVSDNPKHNFGSICLHLFGDEKQIKLTEKILKAINDSACDAAPVKFSYTTDLLQCVVPLHADPDKANPEHINENIYKAFEAMESVLKSSEDPLVGIQKSNKGDVTQFIS